MASGPADEGMYVIQPLRRLRSEGKVKGCLAIEHRASLLGSLVETCFKTEKRLEKCWVVEYLSSICQVLDSVLSTT